MNRFKKWIDRFIGSPPREGFRILHMPLYKNKSKPQNHIQCQNNISIDFTKFAHRMWLTIVFCSSLYLRKLKLGKTYMFLFHTDTDTFEGRTSGLQLMPMRKRKEVLQFIRLLLCYLFLPHVSHRGRLRALRYSFVYYKVKSIKFSTIAPKQ